VVLTAGQYGPAVKDLRKPIWSWLLRRPFAVDAALTGTAWGVTFWALMALVQPDARDPRSAVVSLFIGIAGFGPFAAWLRRHRPAPWEKRRVGKNRSS
jgi:hypothetical protein